MGNSKNNIYYNIDRKAIGNNLRYSRHKIRNLTMEELASDVDVSYTFIAEAEKGRKSPSLETAARMAVRLDASLDFIVFGKVQEAEYNFLSRKLLDLTPEQLHIVTNLVNDMVAYFDAENKKKK